MAISFVPADHLIFVFCDFSVFNAAHVGGKTGQPSVPQFTRRSGSRFVTIVWVCDLRLPNRHFQGIPMTFRLELRSRIGHSTTSRCVMPAFTLQPSSYAA